MIKYKHIKRFFDIIVSYLLLILAYIPMLIIALTILIFDGRPIIFKQVRVGQNEKPFVCYKFRTMKNNAPKNLSTEEFKNASEFITPIGMFLRKTSLDELPQLLNVLAGNMSLVGPRPLIPQEKNIHEIRRREGVYSIRPGITGLAQICGRNLLSDKRKAECDILYLKNLDFIEDITIFFGTFTRINSHKKITKRKNTLLDTPPD